MHHAADHLRYFQVVATIIPVLFIAAAFQVKYWDWKGDDLKELHWFGIIGGVLLVAFIVQGEVEALVVLYNGKTHSSALNATTNALGWLVLLVVLQPLSPWLKELWGRVPPRRQRPIALTVLGGLFLALLAWLVLSLTS